MNVIDGLSYGRENFRKDYKIFPIKFSYPETALEIADYHGSDILIQTRYTKHIKYDLYLYSRVYDAIWLITPKELRRVNKLSNKEEYALYHPIDRSLYNTTLGTAAIKKYLIGPKNKLNF